MSMPDAGGRQVDLGEAARQLQQAAHDAQVAFDCMGLGELDRAHTWPGLKAAASGGVSRPGAAPFPILKAAPAGLGGPARVARVPTAAA